MVQARPATTPAPSTSPDNDEWISSACGMCYGTCSILAHRVDEKVVKIEGNPRSAIVKGRVHLTQAVHPECVGIAACAGHWGKGQPIAKGKGVFFNELLEVDLDHASPVNFNLDLCAKVRAIPCAEE